MPVPLETPTYYLGEWAGNAVDDAGVAWVVEEEEGWSSTATVRGASTDRAGADGAIGGPSLWGKRVIRLRGKALGPSRVPTQDAKDRVKAALPMRAPALFVVEETHRTLWADVRSSEDLMIKDRGPLVFEWQMVLTADDFRRYGDEAISAEGFLGSTGSTGRTYPRTYPLGYALAVTETRAVTVVVDGNEATPAVVDVFGPLLTGWAVLHEQTDRRITVRQALSASERMVLDTGAGTARLDGTANRANTLTQPQWFLLLPGRNTLRLIGGASASTPTPRFTVTAYPAWR